ncbi:uncharacterized protein LOC112505911 [Cynara cardunculus var. scolymus]|uniref:uncharacterized protein LOC112505911 n=1 Tax=Cynara cardunculus var. scolymus TaxID=59895 RepID=UPI000D62E773|nr:uncharacterized protein LOC112505911 [Cynara cardunculus var. scolymus]
MGTIDETVTMPTDPSRVSVFERLSSLEEGSGGNQAIGMDGMVNRKLNFAKAVGRLVDTELNFYPLANKNQASVKIPIEMAKEATKSYNTVLYGYFLGPRIHFPLVQKFVKAAWGKYGYSDAMMNENGIYFFRFNDEGGCDWVIEADPLMVCGVPLFVYRWDPSKGLRKSEHTSCPLWVKLHNIPLVAFNKEGVSRIASALGISKQMDSCTTSMCDKAWGCPGFAKLLVEVWAVGDLKRHIEVLIPNLNGRDDEKVNIQVENIWEPLQCSRCHVFGHKTSSCVKAVNPIKGKQVDGRKDSEGFVRVEKKQWRAKSGGNTQSSIPCSKSSNVKTGRPNPATMEASTSRREQTVEQNVDLTVEELSDQSGQVVKAVSEGPSKGTNGVVKHVSSGTSSTQSNVKYAPLLASVVKSFRLPRRGVMIDSTTVSNIFVVLGNLGGEETQGRELWSGLRKFKVLIGSKPWIVMGDFNAMLFTHDGFGGSSRRNTDMSDFFACVEDVELNEEGGIRHKLDRVLANSEYTSKFHDANGHFLPSGLLDHSPVMKDEWSKHIEGTFMFRVTSHLKALKTPLRKLRNSYDNLVARVSFFESRDASSDPVMSDDLFTRKLSLSEANHMIRPIFNEEIKNAMFSIGNHKAPGSDGYSSRFFKAFLDIIGCDVEIAIHNFFYRGNLPKELNHTFICLIPKSVSASKVSDYRPIACCTMLYKCISEVIVNRMKGHLDSLIDEAQSTFIPGWMITDNILMAHELVSGYQSRDGPPRCTFKIDIKKTYDTVD